ncbi:MAG: helix-hairpin-helix domain-containing protein, partial [Planctomycetota bacterium]
QDIELRSRMRQELWSGILKTKANNTQGKGAQRYKQFFDFEQPVRRIPAAQMLSLRHAEREGIIAFSLDLPEGKAEKILREHLKVDDSKDPALRDFLVLLCGYTWVQLMQPACATDVRRKIKERADLETVRALARNLRSQLMAPPLGPKKALGLRASRKTVWAVTLAEDGSLVEHHTLAVEKPEQRAAAVEQLHQLITTHQPAAMPLAHRRHQEVTNDFLQEVLPRIGDHGMISVAVDEAASAIHATSATGRKELPNLEVGIRTAVSLARRLQDPMHELLGLDPKALGLGHALDEVHQGILSRHLDAAISSCVAKVGMDVNVANASHLSRIPGLSRELARKIVERRRKAGRFSSLAQLQQDLKIPQHDFLQIAGFLRVRGGDEPLDAAGVHPERYELVGRIAASLGLSTAEMLGRDLRSVRIDDFTDKEAGPIALRDVLGTLSRFGRDPRGTLTDVRNPDIHSVKDLRPDQELRGRVTNLTDFGAFLDLGIGQDGLVHVSQIPPQRLRDPRRMLAVGEVITAYVLQVDNDAKRISLTMHRPRHLVEGRQPTIGERLQPSRGRRRRQEEVVAQSRAARAPESRRGQRRGPRRPQERTGTTGLDRPDRRDYRERGGSRPREPRVITIESNMEYEESKGHKGELLSLSSLRSLLARPPKADTQPPAAAEDKDTAVDKQSTPKEKDQANGE